MERQKIPPIVVVLVSLCIAVLGAKAQEYSPIAQLTSDTHHQNANVDEDALVFLKSKSEYSAIRARSGKRLWSHRSESSLIPQVVTVEREDRRLVLLPDEKALYALDATDGEEVWRRSLPDAFFIRQILTLSLKPVVPNAWDPQRVSTYGSGVLFSVGLELQGELDEGEIPERLRQEFEKHGIQLSEDDTSVTDKENGWLITDDATPNQSQYYFVRRRNESLEVYGAAAYVYVISSSADRQNRIDCYEVSTGNLIWQTRLDNEKITADATLNSHVVETHFDVIPEDNIGLLYIPCEERLNIIGQGQVVESIPLTGIVQTKPLAFDPYLLFFENVRETQARMRVFVTQGSRRGEYTERQKDEPPINDRLLIPPVYFNGVIAFITNKGLLRTFFANRRDPYITGITPLSETTIESDFSYASVYFKETEQDFFEDSNPNAGLFRLLVGRHALNMYQLDPYVRQVEDINRPMTSYKIDGAMSRPAQMIESTVYLFTSADGKNSVRALETKDSIQFLWETSVGIGVEQLVPNGPNTLIVLGSDGNLYVTDLNASVGSEQSVTRLEISMNPKDSISSLVSDGHTAYIGTKLSKLYTVRNGAVSGDKPFSYRGAIISPAFSDGKLYFGTTEGWAVQLDLRTGDERIDQPTSTRTFRISPAVTENTLYIGAADGTMYGFKCDTPDEFWSLRPLWAKAVGNSALSSVAVGDSLLVVGDERGFVYGLNPQTGRKLWTSRNTLSGRGISALEINAHLIFARSESGLYWMLDHTGKEIGRFPIDARNRGTLLSPIVHRGMVYVPSTAGKLYRFSYHPEPDLVIQIPKHITSAVLTPDGELLFGTADGTIYTLSLEALPEHGVTISPGIPGRLAVCIGVSPNREGQRLQYVDRDAQEVARVLRENRFRVNLLVREQATYRGITNAFRDLKRDISRMEEVETVVVFYSGHGITDDAENTFLLPYESQYRLEDGYLAAAANLYNVENLIRLLHELMEMGVKNVVFFIDSCYSGKVITTSSAPLDLVPRGVDPRPTPPGFIEGIRQAVQAGTGQSYCIITSAGPREAAFEDKALRHGLFAYHLIQALEGRADGDDDGAVDVHEIFSYVKAQVENHAYDPTDEEPRVLQHPDRLLKGDSFPVTFQTR